jgi:hypothetical protein
MPPAMSGQGPRGASYLPARQAILRVVSRRIWSDFLPRRRVGELAIGVLGCTPQRRGTRAIPRNAGQLGVFQHPAKHKTIP